MFERLDLILKRYQEITQLLMEPQVAADIKKMTTLMKEQRSLEKSVVTYQNYLAKQDQIEGLQMMAEDTDPEISEMASAELIEIKHALDQLEEALKILLLPKDPNDDKNVIVEIKGAAGGDEGNIFAGDLYRMFARYAETNRWKLELLNEIGRASCRERVYI